MQYPHAGDDNVRIEPTSVVMGLPESPDGQD